MTFKEKEEDVTSLGMKRQSRKDKIEDVWRGRVLESDTLWQMVREQKRLWTNTNIQLHCPRLSLTTLVPLLDEVN